MPRITTDVLDGYSLELSASPTGVDIVAISESEDHRVHVPLPWESIATLHQGVGQLLEHHRTQGTPVEADDVLRQQGAEPTTAVYDEEPPSPNEPAAHAEIHKDLGPVPSRDDLAKAFAAVEANEEASAALDAAPPTEASDPRCRRCGARDTVECTELPGGPSRWAVEVIEEKAEQGCSLALGVVNA